MWCYTTITVGIISLSNVNNFNSNGQNYLRVAILVVCSLIKRKKEQSYCTQTLPEQWVSTYGYLPKLFFLILSEAMSSDTGCKQFDQEPYVSQHN